MKKEFIIFSALLISIILVAEVFSQDNNTYSCSKDKRRYWLRDADKDCKLTCGDFFDSFMKEKGYELADYNCITNEPLENEGAKIEENISGISDLKDAELDEESKLETENEEEKVSILNRGYGYISFIVGFLVAIILVWWISSRKRRRKNF